MSIAAYRKKRTTVVEIEGLFCRVRSLGVSDFAELGHVPRAFLLAQGDPEKLKNTSPEEVTKNAEYSAKMQKVVLINCVVIVDKDGKATGEKIVDKAPEDVGENEISWKEFAAPDAIKITNTATNISGMSQEAAKAAAPFPTE
jgi:hypothetical protein